MRVTVLGLGPGPVEYVTPAARARLQASGVHVLLRTRFLPQIELLDGIAWQSCDDLYESASSLGDVESGIVARVLASPANVVLAVPGDGTLGESIVSALRAGGVELEVIPGVGFGPAALAAAGLGAPNGAQLVEATALGGSGIDLLIELNPRWPAVVSGVFSPAVAGELKLALQRIYPTEHRVVVVRHAGLPDEALREVSLSELDRSALDLDHLTCLVVPAVEGYVPNGSAHGLRAIIARLRAPEIGCPWDLQQTHHSLTPYVIEEAYEVVDAIEEDDPASLADELGDLMLQIALHAEIGDQAGEFDWNDVVRNISEKMVRRHPHVFGEGNVQVSGAADVVRNWDQLKAAERAGQPAAASAVDGVAKSLPQLKRAAEISRKASKAGFDWPTREGTLDKVREELAELLAASSLAERREELGDLLYILAKLAQQDGVDPEEALRGANEKFVRRFQLLEAIARERGWAGFAGRPLVDLESAWAEAKRRARQA